MTWLLYNFILIILLYISFDGSCKILVKYTQQLVGIMWQNIKLATGFKYFFQTQQERKCKILLVFN